MLAYLPNGPHTILPTRTSMLMLLFHQFFAHVGIAPLPENMDLVNIALATSLLFLRTHPPTFPCAYLTPM
jgi:hypothetical protein